MGRGRKAISKGKQSKTKPQAAPALACHFSVMDREAGLRSPVSHGWPWEPRTGRKADDCHNPWSSIPPRVIVSVRTERRATGPCNSALSCR